MRKQEVPPISREGRGNPSKDGKEMIFEGAYGTFGSILLMDVRGHQLKSALIGNDGLAITCADFVVQNMVHGGVTGRNESGVNGVVGIDVMGVMFGGKRLHQDSIRSMHSYHDVLVATS